MLSIRDLTEKNILSSTGKSIKKFFEDKTKERQERVKSNNLPHLVDRLDKKEIFCVSFDNMLLIIEGLKNMLYGYNVEVCPADYMELDAFDVTVSYEVGFDENGKPNDKYAEFFFSIILPLEFCDDEDLKRIREWKEVATKEWRNRKFPSIHS